MSTIAQQIMDALWRDMMSQQTFKHDYDEDSACLSPDEAEEWLDDIMNGRATLSWRIHDDGTTQLCLRA